MGFFPVFLVTFLSSLPFCSGTSGLYRNAVFAEKQHNFNDTESQIGVGKDSDQAQHPAKTDSQQYVTDRHPDGS